LDRGDLGTLSREDLLRIPELAINPLGERIVDLFHADFGNNCDRINFLQFMRGLSKFRPIRPNKPNKQNNRMEKIKCNYKLLKLAFNFSFRSEFLLNYQYNFSCL